MEDGSKQRQIFLSLSKLKCGPLIRNQLQGNLPTYFDILSELEAAVAIVDAKTP